MSSGLDRSLDDMIRNNKRSGSFHGNARGRNRSSGSGPVRRFTDRDMTRNAPYSIRQPMQVQGSMWQQQILMPGGSNVEMGTKLYVSNLDYGVSNEDIKVLFSEVGELKRYSINYDRSGRSKGTAEVVFTRQTDALAAIKRYNNMQLDGKPVNIELVGMNLVTPTPVMPPTSNSILGKPEISYGRGQERGPRDKVRGRGGRGSVHGFPRGRGQGRNRSEKVSVEDLDADLETYHLKAMQLN